MHMTPLSYAQTQCASYLFDPLLTIVTSLTNIAEGSGPQVYYY